MCDINMKKLATRIRNDYNKYLERRLKSEAKLRFILFFMALLFGVALGLTLAPLILS